MVLKVQVIRSDSGTEDIHHVKKRTSLLCDVIHDKRLNSANETTVSKACSQHKDVWVLALSSARKSGVFCLHSQTLEYQRLPSYLGMSSNYWVQLPACKQISERQELGGGAVCEEWLILGPH